METNKMKEVIIKNEFDRSYLLIDKEDTEDCYEYKMIMQNKIPGLLDCKLRYLEDRVYCAYDITSKKSLEQEYASKKISFVDLTELFYGINKVIKTASEYLLRQEGFQFWPRYIFTDLETEEVECLYLPSAEGLQEEKREIYKKLAEFLLDKVDHKDEHAVNIAYHFYKISKEEFFSFDSFVNFMEKEAALVLVKERKEKNIEVENSNYSWGKNMSDMQECADWEESTADEKEIKQKWWIPGILLAIGGILVFTYVMIPGLEGYALYVLLPGLSMIVSAIILILRATLLIVKNNREFVSMEKAGDIRVEEYFDNMEDDVTVFFDKEEYINLKWKEGHFSKEHCLEKFPVTVGKLRESTQLYINDSSVSRLHARFRKQGNDIYSQDLDSTNGTFVNEKKLRAGEEAIIKRGDEIQFGKIIVNVV